MAYKQACRLVLQFLLLQIVFSLGDKDKGRRHCTPKPHEDIYSYWVCITKEEGDICDAAYFAVNLPDGAARILGAHLLRTARPCGQSCCLGGCPMNCHICNDNHDSKHVAFCYDHCYCTRPKDLPSNLTSLTDETTTEETYTEIETFSARKKKPQVQLCVLAHERSKSNQVHLGPPRSKCNSTTFNIVPESLRILPGMPSLQRPETYVKEQYCCAGGAPQTWCGSCVQDKATNGAFGACRCVK